MQANWSLILNVLLLVGVIVAIGRLMKARKLSLNPEQCQPPQGLMGKEDSRHFNDDIIAVRKINTGPSIGSGPKDEELLHQLKKTSINASQPRLIPQNEELRPDIKIEPKPAVSEIPATVMMFLVAKEKRQFAGYELLQTVLAAGLRFGEGHLFHRHQFPNGQGPVLCGLAAATATGVFDLQNIGAFSVRGLCLYMHSSKNPGIDKERFSVMLDTARQLSEGLDAHLLDEERTALTEERIVRYYRLLQINPNN